MRYRSKKREREYRQRRPLVERILEERPLCEACVLYAALENKATFRQQPSCDVHEIINRSQGGSILQEPNLLSVCRGCHRRITVHPYEAETLGLHLPSWATVEMYDEAATLRGSWSKGIPLEPSWRD